MITELFPSEVIGACHGVCQMVVAECLAPKAAPDDRLASRDHATTPTDVVRIVRQQQRHIESIIAGSLHHATPVP